MVTPETIDIILKAEKRIAGIASWVSSKPNTVKLKAPLMLDGAVKSGLFLSCDTTTHTIKQHGSLVLVYQDKPIERMNFFPQGPHVNKVIKSIPHEFRGLVFPLETHRYYAWVHNRRWPRLNGDNMDVASPIDRELKVYKEAISYFFQKTGMIGSIPEPPHEPRFEFNDRRT